MKTGDKIKINEFKIYKKGIFTNKKFQNLGKKLDKIFFIKIPETKTEILIEKYNKYIDNYESLNENFKELEIAILKKDNLEMKKILKKLKPELKLLITQKKELLKLVKSEKNKLAEINIPKYYVVKDKRLSKLVAKIDKIIEKRKKKLKI